MMQTDVSELRTASIIRAINTPPRHLSPFAWLWPTTFPTGPAKIQPDPTDSRIYNSFLARERQKYTKGIKKRDDATKNHSTKNFDGHYSLILDYGIFVSESIPSDCTLNVQ
jgi:hypothetical protein